MSHPLYKTKQWYSLRRTVLNKEPLCRICRVQHNRYVSAYAIDHIVAHKGDLKLFYDINNLQPLCQSCHNKIKQGIEARGYDTAIDLDGFPIDPKHPANR